jgi:hypothetical protein
MAIATQIHARFQCAWLVPGMESEIHDHTQISVGAGYDPQNKIWEFCEIDGSLRYHFEGKERWLFTIAL